MCGAHARTWLAGLRCPSEECLPAGAGGCYPALNAWIGEALDPGNRDRTVAALLADQHRRAGDTSARRGIKRRLANAETRLRRLREAIEAGAHPEALVDSINDAQAQRAAAGAELDAVGPAPDLMADAEVYARLDALSDIKRT
ncbi:hypothetical protein [Pseudonocardia acaciae]|uniref:hypothetical protein n=1 Tax=Pseudonocardia acaciae TaxID=551276 RepID=UPI000B0471F9|nr:hypothetical protein [Pseudonocardia acaciae]